MDVNFISPFPREPLHQQMVLKPGHTPAHDMVAYFCHHLSDNYVDLSDNYVDLSDLNVDLSDLYVDLSVIYVVFSDQYLDLSEKYHYN